MKDKNKKKEIIELVQAKDKGGHLTYEDCWEFIFPTSSLLFKTYWDSFQRMFLESELSELSQESCPLQIFQSTVEVMYLTELSQSKI